MVGCLIWVVESRNGNQKRTWPNTPVQQINIAGELHYISICQAGHMRVSNLKRNHSPCDGTVHPHSMRHVFLEGWRRFEETNTILRPWGKSGCPVPKHPSILRQYGAVQESKFGWLAILPQRPSRPLQQTGANMQISPNFPWSLLKRSPSSTRLK